MMNATMINKMEILKDNMECQQQLAEASTPEDACEILNQYGIELSLEEVKALIRDESELSVNDLDTVAGGCHGFRHIIGFRIVWMPIAIVRGKIVYGPMLVPVYCKR